MSNEQEEEERYRRLRFKKAEQGENKGIVV